MYAKGEGAARDIEHAKRLFDEAEYKGLDVSQMRASIGLRASSVAIRPNHRSRRRVESSAAIREKATQPISRKFHGLMD